MAEPRSVAGYLLLRRLARGGTGEVWEARRRDGAGPHVALKLFHASDERANVRRFLEEARVGALLQHPSVVRTLDVGAEGDQLFLVQELLEGRTLAQLIRDEEPLPPALVAALGLQLLSGLAYLHEQATDSAGNRLRLVHRDLKPSNLFVTSAGQVKIIDFGIAVSEAQDRTLTRTGQVRGTLPYLAPEQPRGEGVDARTDLFSVGLVLHELLTGRRVFDQRTDAEVLRAVLWLPIPTVRSRGVDLPLPLEELVNQLLERDKALRPSSAAAAARLLRAAVPEADAWTEERIAAWARARPIPVATERPDGTLGGAPIPEALAAPPPTRTRVRPRHLAVALVLLAVGAAAAAAVWTLRGPARTPPPPVAVQSPAPPEPPAPEAAPERAPQQVAEPAPAQKPEAKPKRDRRARPAESRAQARRPGWLTVGLESGWASVRVDGEPVGVTPIFRHSLPPGRYALEAVRPDGETHKRSITITSGRETKLLLPGQSAK